MMDHQSVLGLDSEVFSTCSHPFFQSEKGQSGFRSELDSGDVSLL